MSARALIAAFALLATVPAATKPAPAGHAVHAAAPARHAPAAHAATALPDTVIAKMFFSPGEGSITASQFRLGALKMHADPDSLTPEQRRELAGVLVQQAVLEHRIAQAPPGWLHRDSTNLASLADMITLRAGVDSVLTAERARLMARGDSVPTRRKLLDMVRDSALARMNVVYDVPAMDSLAAAFAALPQEDPAMPTMRRLEIRNMMPHVSARDSARVLARFELGSYTTGDLLRERGQTNTMNRPPVATRGQLRSAVDDVLYTRVLRRDLDRRHAERRPDIAAQLASRRQFLTAQRFVQNEVYDRVPVDTASVRQWFDRDPRHYDMGGTARVVRTLDDSRSAADSSARALASAAWAESLSSREMRPGLPYATPLAEDADSVLFARVRAAGVGGVLGPDETPDGWRVLRVMSLAPRKPLTLAEAFVRARSDWIEADGERRMHELMDRLMAACRVVMNDSSSYLTGRSHRPH